MIQGGVFKAPPFCVKNALIPRKNFIAVIDRRSKIMYNKIKCGYCITVPQISIKEVRVWKAEVTAV